MRGYAEILSERDPDVTEAEREEFLERIRRAANRMDLLITDALSYSKAVREELALSRVEPELLLRGMIETYPEFQPNRAKIEIVGKIPAVTGNEAGLIQCFSNLLGNAVKFVKPGQCAEVKIRAETRSGWVRLWFEDKGIGIAETMLPHLFEMFARGHQDYEGTGIGLALVRKVMERMGGNLGVQSQEGRGSRFWLDLRPADWEAKTSKTAQPDKNSHSAPAPAVKVT
jgi:signal transduction histidine kinase